MITGVVYGFALLLLFNTPAVTSCRERRQMADLKHGRSIYDAVTRHVISASDVEEPVLQRPLHVANTFANVTKHNAKS